ncbi:hypothetical protein BDB00DRAFT_753574 [Zychaea mexicana]|uniref:uncharacterized protein n=1 Tax=Zychaea mexicana TaxID=64656 RepID=UPI0022FE18E6|nr:uncharacterized protein BDB00DRAFT_753574 [Zychaea mexicana]KAI9499140.1 hypothetical protein BDB00DRAFT_753574 [Zychaea mexicana]
MTVETFTETKTVIASSTTNIHPNIKSIYASFPAKVPLSGLDCFHYPSEVLIHWLFRSPPAATNAVIDKLKATLAEALEFYPLLTGTVCGHKSGDLYIAMDEQSRSGIPFIFEKRITPYDGDSDTMQPRKFTHLLGPGSITFIVKVVQVYNEKERLHVTASPFVYR